MSPSWPSAAPWAWRERSPPASSQRWTGRSPGAASESRALVDLIQVDAAISPGNSGGALLDTTGRVIGINQAYIPPTAGAVSLGFAIPAATAVDVVEQLLTEGRAIHPFLGLSPAPITPATG